MELDCVCSYLFPKPVFSHCVQTAYGQAFCGIPSNLHRWQGLQNQQPEADIVKPSEVLRAIVRRATLQGSAYIVA